MSSYADVAASSGPQGAEKVPRVPEVETRTEPHGSVQTAPAEEVERINEGGSHPLEKESRSARKLGVSFHQKAITIIQDGINKLKQKAGVAYNSLSVNSKKAACVASTELKNPVVVSQVLLGLSGSVASYILYAERGRINTNNKAVIAIHAGIITGLVLLDGFLVKTYYPKYKKQ